MRRLLRWSFNLTAAVSAVLLVVTCLMWVRSYFVADTVRRGNVNGGTPPTSAT